MSLSFLNIVKKEDVETESAAADANENAETGQEEAQNKGEHGKDFCCGSCS